MKIGFVEIDIEALNKECANMFHNYENFYPSKKEDIDRFMGKELYYWQTGSLKRIEIFLMEEQMSTGIYKQAYYDYYLKLTKELAEESTLKQIRHRNWAGQSG